MSQNAVEDSIRPRNKPINFGGNVIQILLGLGLRLGGRQVIARVSLGVLTGYSSTVTILRNYGHMAMSKTLNRLRELKWTVGGLQRYALY